MVTHMDVLGSLTYSSDVSSANAVTASGSAVSGKSGASSGQTVPFAATLTSVVDSHQPGTAAKDLQALISQITDASPVAAGIQTDTALAQELLTSAAAGDATATVDAGSFGLNTTAEAAGTVTLLASSALDQNFQADILASIDTEDAEAADADQVNELLQDLASLIHLVTTGEQATDQTINQAVAAGSSASAVNTADQTSAAQAIAGQTSTSQTQSATSKLSSAVGLAGNGSTAVSSIANAASQSVSGSQAVPVFKPIRVDQPTVDQTTQTTEVAQVTAQANSSAIAGGPQRAQLQTSAPPASTSIQASEPSAPAPVQPATTDSSDSLTAADAAGATQVQPEVRSSAEVSASGLTEFGGTSGQTLAQDAALTAAGRSAVDRVQPEAQLRQADQQGVNAANDAGSTAAVSDVSAVALPGSQSVEQAGPQPMTEQIRHVVVQHVQQNADTQSSRLTVRLDPPELGVLELDLSLTEDGLDVKIHARENVTLDMLLARSPELERLLKAQDLNIRKVEVDALIPEGSAGYSGSNEQQSQTEQRDRTAFSDVGRRHPASGRNHQADVPVQRNNRRAAAYGFRA